jgi:glycosyltransferase involved in cell wall biosynthesis
MKVSIITVALNASETIEATIHSVLDQDYKDIEYIVVDGGSTDGTLDIINSYGNKIARVISEPDNGIYEAMNKGIKLSTGDIIATLNSDDVYTEHTVVSRIVEFMKSNSLDAAYGDLVYIDKNSDDHITRFWRAGKYKKGAFSYGWILPHPTFFCRKEVFERFGYFNDKLQVAADFELMLRFIEKHNIQVGYLPKVIVKMRKGGKANVVRGIIRGNLEIISSFRQNDVRISPWFFFYRPITKILQLFARPDQIKL